MDISLEKILENEHVSSRIDVGMVSSIVNCCNIDVCKATGADGISTQVKINGYIESPGQPCLLEVSKQFRAKVLMFQLRIQIFIHLLLWNIGTLFDSAFVLPLFDYCDAVCNSC